MSVSKLLSSCKKRWELYISLEMIQYSTVCKINSVIADKIQGCNCVIADREEKLLCGKTLICNALWATFSASIVQTRCSADQTRLMVSTTKFQAQLALLKPAACFKEESIMPGDRSVAFSMGLLIRAGTLIYQNTAMNTICKFSLYRFTARLCMYGRV